MKEIKLNVPDDVDVGKLLELMKLVAIVPAYELKLVLLKDNTVLMVCPICNTQKHIHER